MTADTLPADRARDEFAEIDALLARGQEGAERTATLASQLGSFADLGGPHAREAALYKRARELLASLTASRDAATTGEPTWYLLRFRDNKERYNFYPASRKPEVDELIAAGSAFESVPLYSRPDPQVAALTEKLYATRRREQEALNAHTATFGALDQIRLLLNQDDLVDYQNVVNGVAALTASLEAEKKAKAWWEAELRDTLRGVTAECNIAGINAIVSFALDLRRKAGRPDGAALPSGDAPR